MSFSREWFTVNSVTDENNEIEIRQVYVWLVTSDKKIVIVSKDGEKWQFPGGHPDEEDNSLIHTATREVLEETGLDISDVNEDLEFFGYYLIDEDGDRFLQVRFILNLDKDSNDLDLNTHNEVIEDSIKFIKAVTLKEATELIPWLSSTDEFKVIQSKI